MSTIVRIPKNAVSEFDLPRVCVATGATEGVGYHKVTFQFVPMWARLSVAFCGIVGLVIMMLNTRRVQAEIPFTDEAFKAYKRARIVPALIIVGALPLVFVPMLIDEDLALLGVIAFFAALIGAIVYAVVVTKQSGPIVKEIDETTITLELPSDEAARAFEARLHGGVVVGGGVGVDTPAGRDEYDDALDRELERIG